MHRLMNTTLPAGNAIAIQMLMLILMLILMLMLLPMPRLAFMSFTGAMPRLITTANAAAPSLPGAADAAATDEHGGRYRPAWHCAMQLFPAQYSFSKRHAPRQALSYAQLLSAVLSAASYGQSALPAARPADPHFGSHCY